MLELLTHAVIAGFIVSTPPGLTQLIAFERILNRSFLAGWKIALGGTFAHLIFATLAVTGISYASGWLPFDKLSLFIHSHKLEIVGLLGVLMLVIGMVYLRKKPSKPHIATEAGFLIGLTIPLLDLGNIATHTAAISATGYFEYTLVQGMMVVFASALGGHISWAWKLGLVQLGKRQLQKRKVENFNRVFGMMLIGMALMIFAVLTIILAIK